MASMDYYEIDADKANEYISHLDGVKAFTGGSKEEQFEQIITQKWIAVFPNGNEGWAEVSIPADCKSAGTLALLAQISCTYGVLVL